MHATGIEPTTTRARGVKSAGAPLYHPFIVAAKFQKTSQNINFPVFLPEANNFRQKEARRRGGSGARNAILPNFAYEKRY